MLFNAGTSVRPIIGVVLISMSVIIVLIALRFLSGEKKEAKEPPSLIL